MHHSGTIEAILRPSSFITNRVIYSRNRDDNSATGSENYFTFEVLTTEYLSARLDSGSTNQETISATTDKISSSAWAYVAITWAWDQTATQFNLMKNSDTAIKSLASAVIVDPPVFLLDSKNFVGYIAREDESSGNAAVASNLFNGFIYEYAISNYVITPSSYFSSSCTGYSGCTSCPLTNSCLSTCDIDQYPISDGTCGPCYSTCTQGCVTQEHCGLCDDRECQNCDDFTVGATCANCYPTHTSVSGGECKCNDLTNEKWYSDISDQCYSCHVNCDDCYGSITRESVYDCTVCASGLFLHMGICEDYCPTLYSEGSAVCDKAVSDSALLSVALNYEDLQWFVEETFDTVSNHPARLGYGGKYPDPYNSYPMILRNGGLHFDGGDYLVLSPYTGQTAQFVFNYSHTVEIVMRSDGSITAKQIILNKADTTTGDNRSTLAIDSNSDLLLELYMLSVMKDGTPSQESLNFGALVTDGKWNHLTYTVDLQGSQAAVTTVLKVYIDGTLLGQNDVIDRTVKDFYTNEFYIGAKKTTNNPETSYTGTIADFKVYQFAKDATQVQTAAARVTTGGSCGCNQCLDNSTCLTPCSINQYYPFIGGACIACDEACIYGCVRDDNLCKLNEDPKCLFGESDSFAPNTCNTCVQSAFIYNEGDACECTPNSNYDITEDKCVCFSGFRVRFDQTCEPCEPYIQLADFLHPVYFHEDYLGIQLRFAKPIDTTQSTNCDFILEPAIEKLGSGPICNWTSDKQKCNISFGSNPTLLFDETITLDHNKIYLDTDGCEAESQELVRPT